ncbi:hypothetical protein JH06_0407 [Blastocystis sp. subtype 4]|uniref:hypothetical protein n=1 Tax=Blastocystis sp. subtype 4 TaxID=944170 RepID=UPI0007121E09|nr:hypothetical protein JH06_0407 [Blastocystis sp. subtype 4]KNB45981.1 hypothetical protein JH06_0407 [Blastocystis sp. subtype 4]|eukprot:XP_014529424.1 hypothetical protein JH06_0407 [Blastocystis sp. subtype 4]
MADILTNLTTLKDQAKKIRDVVNQLPQSLENGVSLLDLKSQFMLSYNELLLVYLLLKIEGVDLQDHPLFASLVRERSLLEKLEPLELKMKNHIDNILHPQEGEESNPLRFHANLDDLDSSSDTAESQDEKASKSGVYVPPKIAAVPYTDKDSERDERRKEQLKDRIASNAFISELRHEMSDRPEAINMRSTGDLSLDRELKERRDFEESNFTRVNLSREQKKRMRQANLSMQRGRKLGEFDEFDSLTRLVKESEKVTGQIIDEDEHGNRFKRVGDSVDTSPKRRKGGRGRKGKH